MGNENNIIKQALNVSGGRLGGDEFRLNVEIDYSGVGRDQLLTWATSNRIIALQRNLRMLPQKSLTELSQNGYRIHAINCGRKIMSREAQIEETANRMIASGLDEETALKAATVIVDSPAKVAKLMDEVKK